MFKAPAVALNATGFLKKTADKKGAVTWKRVPGIFILNLFTFLREGTI